MTASPLSSSFWRPVASLTARKRSLPGRREAPDLGDGKHPALVHGDRVEDGRGPVDTQVDGDLPHLARFKAYDFEKYIHTFYRIDTEGKLEQ